jgi:hypothetical protein
MRRSLPQGRKRRKLRRPTAVAPMSSLDRRRVCNLARMNDRRKTPEKARRQLRLGAALRENLKRRKAQAKGRSTASGAGKTATPHDSAGIAGDKQES